MELDKKEQLLVQSCRKEESSWTGWEWCFFGAGVVLLGFGILALYLMSAVSNPQDVPQDLKQTLVVAATTAFVLSLYLFDSGVHERRERNFRRLLLKFVNQVEGRI